MQYLYQFKMNDQKLNEKKTKRLSGGFRGSNWSAKMRKVASQNEGML